MHTCDMRSMAQAVITAAVLAGVWVAFNVKLPCEHNIQVGVVALHAGIQHPNSSGIH